MMRRSKRGLLNKQSKHFVEDGLVVQEFPTLGRGVVADKDFKTGDFICQYKGELIDAKQGYIREKKGSGPSFLYFFKWKSKNLCIDASKEDGSFGRLINHWIPGNIKPRLLSENDTPKICFFATTNIQMGSQLFYNYGEKRKEVLLKNPWLTTSTQKASGQTTQVNQKKSSLPNPKKVLLKTSNVDNQMKLHHQKLEKTDIVQAIPEVKEDNGKEITAVYLPSDAKKPEAPPQEIAVPSAIRAEDGLEGVDATIVAIGSMLKEDKDSEHVIESGVSTAEDVISSKADHAVPNQKQPSEERSDFCGTSSVMKADIGKEITAVDLSLEAKNPASPSQEIVVSSTIMAGDGVESVDASKAGADGSLVKGDQAVKDLASPPSSLTDTQPSPIGAEVSTVHCEDLSTLNGLNTVSMNDRPCALQSHGCDNRFELPVVTVNDSKPTYCSNQIESVDKMNDDGKTELLVKAEKDSDHDIESRVSTAEGVISSDADHAVRNQKQPSEERSDSVGTASMVTADMGKKITAVYPPLEAKNPESPSQEIVVPSTIVAEDGVESVHTTTRSLVSGDEAGTDSLKSCPMKTRQRERITSLMDESKFVFKLSSKPTGFISESSKMEKCIQTGNLDTTSAPAKIESFEDLLSDLDDVSQPALPSDESGLPNFAVIESSQPETLSSLAACLQKTISSNNPSSIETVKRQLNFGVGLDVFGGDSDHDIESRVSTAEGVISSDADHAVRNQKQPSEERSDSVGTASMVTADMGKEITAVYPPLEAKNPESPSQEIVVSSTILAEGGVESVDATNVAIGSMVKGDKGNGLASTPSPIGVKVSTVNCEDGSSLKGLNTNSMSKPFSAPQNIRKGRFNFRQRKSVVHCYSEENCGDFSDDDDNFNSNDGDFDSDDDDGDKNYSPIGERTSDNEIESSSSSDGEEEPDEPEAKRRKCSEEVSPTVSVSSNEENTNELNTVRRKQSVDKRNSSFKEDSLDEDEDLNGSESSPDAQDCGRKIIKVQKIDKKRCINNRDWSKLYACFYCGEQKTKLVEHFQSKHNKEESVMEIMALPKGGKERIAAIAKLRNAGAYKHNQKVLSAGEGVLQVKKRKLRSSSPTNYKSCPYCGSLYSAASLYKHKKVCMKTSEKAVPMSCRGTKIISSNPSDYHKEYFYKVIIGNSKKRDDVAATISNDKLLCDFGISLVESLPTNSDQDNNIRTTLRLMSQFLLKIKLINKSIKCFNDVFQSKHFDSSIEATLLVSGYSADTGIFKIPTRALRIGEHLEKIAALIIKRAIKNGDKDLRSSVEDYLYLRSKDWPRLVNNKVHLQMKESRYNGGNPLPDKEDVVRLADYLYERTPVAFKKLKTNPTAITYTDLSTLLITSVMLFNRKRPGDIQKLKLGDYQKVTTTSTHTDIWESLSEEEKSLVNSLKRIENRGKKFMKVPILFTKSMQESVELLIEKRTECGVPTTNLFVFARVGAMSYLRACDTLRFCREDAGCLHPDRVTSTSLRKEAATLAKVAGLTEVQIKELADFLGHNIRTHEQHYRLPQGTLQTAKVSKYLHSLSKASKQSKRADNISSASESEEDETLEVDQQLTIPDNQPSTSSSRIQNHTPRRRSKGKQKYDADDDDSEAVFDTRKKRKLTKVKWTTPQRNAVDRHLGKYLQLGKVPGRSPCEKANRDPALRSRSWTNIKDYVRNKLLKQAKQRE